MVCIKTLYSRFIRWSCLGVFDRIFVIPILALPGRLLTHIPRPGTTREFSAN
ncbi:hypothetical protein GKA01_26320 [Gluconobacter kanchanaburiensis NBRC 103587]|uniref:Uncharacterized protein n=1 Tax=Gluconobacter kanchanaburiensis NBRC 103587 TaxID=1307948 RepID=A0A511BAK6_9PROT|nr:hypothetical protein GKA01_26320 [Gluconobacter kanchanaburiensis NBRC 103587]